jgi:hypothetical protein
VVEETGLRDRSFFASNTISLSKLRHAMSNFETDIEPVKDRKTLEP